MSVISDITLSELSCLLKIFDNSHSKLLVSLQTEFVPTRVEHSLDNQDHERI